MNPLDLFFHSYYRLRPVNATFTGVHDYDGRLPEWSPDGLAAAADTMQSLRAQLVAARDDRPLTDVDARDRELAISFLDVQLAELESGHFQHANPSLALGEAAFGVISLVTRPFADAASRSVALGGRLLRTTRFLEEAQRSLVAIPDEWRRKALRECDGFARLLDGALVRWIQRESDDKKVWTIVSATNDGAAQGLERFRRWLEHDAPRASVDRCAIGPDAFDLLLARGHWCDRPRAQLARDAHAALDEALARLDERARAMASGGWPEVQDRLANRHPTVDGYLAAYRDTWNACREKAETLDLVTWPEYPIRYVPIPAHTRDAAPFLYYLFYRSPAPFDRLPIHDYVVTPIEADMDPAEQERRLYATNTSVIKLNHVVHHGAIGHHVQNYYAYASASAIGRVAAVDCASRIGMFLGGTMAEGWACYATDLMDECGFLTPEESVAQQHTRARLLARAVVDIGLHERSLTFDDAVAIYRDRVGMPPDAARAEVCKNSMFPGTAVMYWLGTEGLHQLRRARERIEGASFSLKRFHDRLLSFGSIPVPLIARIWT